MGRACKLPPYSDFNCRRSWRWVLRAGPEGHLLIVRRFPGWQEGTWDEACTMRSDGRQMRFLSWVLGRSICFFRVSWMHRGSINLHRFKESESFFQVMIFSPWVYKAGVRRGRGAMIVSGMLLQSVLVHHICRHQGVGRVPDVLSRRVA